MTVFFAPQAERRTLKTLALKKTLASAILGTIASAPLILSAHDSPIQPSPYVLEEIHVSAQKREEKLQQVPLSITAFSGANLNAVGAQTITDIGRMTPGVEMINESYTQPEHTIRGVHTTDFTIGSDPSIAVYTDGIYSARGGAAELALYDVERIEILKGPQGTLWGRNATGGAIHLISKKPVWHQEGRIRLSAGNDRKRDASFTYNTPINDTLAGRISGMVNRRAGHLENISGPNLNDIDNQSFRAALRWIPDDQNEVIWRTEYSTLQQNSGTVFTTTPNVYAAGQVDQPYDPFGPVVVDRVSSEQQEHFSSTIEAVHDFAAFTLTSLTGYRSLNVRYVNDEDGSSDPGHSFVSDNTNKQTLLSQELRLNGEHDAIIWTLGANFTREDISHHSKAYFNRDTLENFALYSALQNDPDALAAISPLLSAANLGLPPAPTDQALANAINPIRSHLQQFGLNGIATAAFTANLYQQQTAPSDGSLGSGNFGGLHGIASSGDCPGGPYSSAGAAADALGKSFAIACALLPQVQNRLGSAPWLEQAYNTGTYNSFALYADATVALTDQTNLTGGVRYSYDDKQFSLNTGYTPENFYYRAVPSLGGLTLPLGLALYNNGLDGKFITQHWQQDWHSFSGRIVLDHHPSDTLMLFGSLSTGFKAGGFNSLSFGPSVDPAFDQEEVINYELGVKSDLFDQRLRLNVSAFYYEYSNKQDLELVGSPLPSYNVLLADARGHGAEMEALWSTSEAWLLSTNYSYLDTTIVSDNSAVQTEKDRQGQPLSHAPRHKINLRAQYSHSLAHLGGLMWRLDYHWSSERVGQPTGEAIDSFALTNARVTWTSPQQQWQLSSWVNNLTNERLIADYVGPAKAIGSHTAWRYPERMYGLDLTFHY